MTSFLGARASGFKGLMLKNQDFKRCKVGASELYVHKCLGVQGFKA